MDIHLRQYSTLLSSGSGGSGSSGSSGSTTTAATTTFYVTDHLGTASLEFSATGALLWQGEFAPFGGEFPEPTTTTNRYKFTGKERDTESGLDYFGARYYASSMGRFTSPDNPFADQHTDNPQSWNMYAYVRNNPLRFTDPTGLSTHTNAGGDVTSVSDDGDLGVYRDYRKRHRNNGKTTYTNESERMGETEYWDEFRTPDDSAIGAGAHIEFGASFDDAISWRNFVANGQDLEATAGESKLHGYFDIKNDKEIAPFGPYTGKLLNGKYASARSAGNFLAGEDAATGTMFGFHISAITNMKLAGALQQGQFSKANAIKIITTGKAYGPAPWYGEEGYSGRRIQEGFEYGSKHKE